MAHLLYQAKTHTVVGEWLMRRTREGLCIVLSVDKRKMFVLFSRKSRTLGGKCEIGTHGKPGDPRRSNKLFTPSNQAMNIEYATCTRVRFEETNNRLRDYFLRFRSTLSVHCQRLVAETCIFYWLLSTY